MYKVSQKKQEMDFRKGMNIEKNISVEPYFDFIFLLYF